MVRAIRQFVRIRPGGRVEFVSPYLPDGAEAEVIVLLSGQTEASPDCWGVFADEPELIDQVIMEAMDARQFHYGVAKGYKCT